MFINYCVANFCLPAEEDTPFAEILFVGLERAEAKEVIDLYNKVHEVFNNFTEGSR